MPERTPVGFEVGEWGPDTCKGCDVALPQGLIALGKDRHVDCEEARSAWLHLQSVGKAPRMLPRRR